MGSLMVLAQSANVSRFPGLSMCQFRSNLFTHFKVTTYSIMLYNSFFTIESIEDGVTEDSRQHIMARIRLQPGHPVFKGHFPENPVVPGVCQVQMIREIIEYQSGKRLSLAESDNIKFLAMIIPDQNPTLGVTMDLKVVEEGNLSVNATIHHGSSIFLKFKGKYHQL